MKNAISEGQVLIHLSYFSNSSLDRAQRCKNLVKHLFQKVKKKKKCSVQIGKIIPLKLDISKCKSQLDLFANQTMYDSVPDFSKVLQEITNKNLFTKLLNSKTGQNRNSTKQGIEKTNDHRTKHILIHLGYAGTHKKLLLQQTAVDPELQVPEADRNQPGQKRNYGDKNFFGVLKSGIDFKKIQTEIDSQQLCMQTSSACDESMDNLVYHHCLSKYKSDHFDVGLISIVDFVYLSCFVQEKLIRLILDRITKQKMSK